MRATFASGRTRSVEWRKQQLKALGAMITENEAAVAAALEQDLGRNPFEAFLADIAPTVGEAKDAEKHVRKWMRRRYRLLEMSQLPGRGWIEYEPYGTVLIIGAWNFPFVLTLGPGCRRHRGGKHRGAQTVGGGACVVRPDGRAGAEVSGQRRDRGHRG